MHDASHRMSHIRHRRKTNTASRDGTLTHEANRRHTQRQPRQSARMNPANRDTRTQPQQTKTPRHCDWWRITVDIAAAIALGALLGKLHAPTWAALLTATLYALLTAREWCVCRATITTLELNEDTWVLGLKLDRTRQEPPRLLARRSDRLYTTDPHQAMPHEPEAIDPDTQERISRRARETHAAFQTQHSPPLHIQLQQELDRAAAAGVDVTHLRLAIEQRVRALRRRNDQAA